MKLTNPKAKGSVALIKAVSLVKQIATAKDGLTVPELTAVSGQSKSAVHRTLSSLEHCGWLETRPLNASASAWFLSTDFIGMAYLWKRCALSGAAMSGECFMSASAVCTLSPDLVMKAVQLFHLVLGGGTRGKTLDELRVEAGCARTTTYRLLCTWEKLGWLKSMDLDGRSEKWFASTKLIDLAHQYENQQRCKLTELKETYESVTGESL
jgi:DNA-binding IclR family transcriptional regulator